MSEKLVQDQKGWRAYAGQILDYQRNWYFSGVIGQHYWKRPGLPRPSHRTSGEVQDCNPFNWGMGNWDTI